ncbi:hypothetical protein ACS0TY_007010 [Phlomoides rotata]
MLACPLEACWSSSFKVHLVNELPEDDRYALAVHCRSGDDDLGYHIIGHTQDYKWGFCEAVFSNTVFGCDFWWAHKFIHFDVFNKNISYKCKFDCTWKVRDDGFYLQDRDGYTYDRYMGW